MRQYRALFMMMVGVILCWPVIGLGQFDVSADFVLEGKVFDARRGILHEPGVVVVSGNRVVCSGHREDCQWPKSTPTRKFDDATILPGLIDLHVHAGAHFIAAYVPSGVTTIRDPGNVIEVVRNYRAHDRAPRVFAGGPRLDGPETAMARFSENVGKLVDVDLETAETIVLTDADEAAAAVEALVDAGMLWIKLYEKLSSEAFASAVQTAHRLGARTSGDIGMVLTRGLSGSTLDFIQTAQLGLDTNEHHSGLALAYQRRGGNVMDPDLDSELLDEIAREAAPHLQTIVPTLLILTQFADPDQGRTTGVPGAELAEEFFGARWASLVQISEPVRERAAADVRLGRAMLTRLMDLGVLVGVGTDTPQGPYIVPGGAIHQELQLLVEAGMSPTQALKAATWDGARILGRDDLGHLAPGALADIVVVRGDPTRNIQDTRRIKAVWFNGAEVDLEVAWSRAESDLRAHAQEAASEPSATSE